MPVRHYNIEQSRALLDRSNGLLVRGCQVHKRNHDMMAIDYPIFAERAAGARFWDVDGNEYLDYLMGFGPILLGYNDPVINAAVRAQMEEGTIYSIAHPKELDVAQMLIDLIPAVEMVGLLLGGSAATSAAVRMARAYTGRDKIIRCGYHGWHDWSRSEDEGAPAAIGPLTIEVPYGDLDAMEDIFKKNDSEVACVIMETIQGDGPPEGFLQGCVDVAHQYGALCIFDEVKVGFRVAFGGAGEHYGVTPDLTTFAKACFNGYPGSIVGGRKEILDSPRCQSSWFVATFNCDLPSLVSIETVVNEVKRRDGIDYQWKIGNRLIEGVNDACDEGSLGFRLTGPGPMPAPVMEEEDKARCITMLQGCLARGHYLHPVHPWFLSLSHTEQDIEDTIVSVQESIADLD